MRYRPLSPSGDYTIGQPFLQDSAAAVGQLVLTRLKLWQGEWFVDITDGTPVLQNVLGKQFGSPDPYIKQRILGTQGVTSILSYSSAFDGSTRMLTVSATIATLYGQTTVTL